MHGSRRSFEARQHLNEITRFQIGADQVVGSEQDTRPLQGSPELGRRAVDLETAIDAYRNALAVLSEYPFVENLPVPEDEADAGARAQLVRMFRHASLREIAGRCTGHHPVRAQRPCDQAGAVADAGIANPERRLDAVIRQTDALVREAKVDLNLGVAPHEVDRKIHKRQGTEFVRRADAQLPVGLGHGFQRQCVGGSRLSQHDNATLVILAAQFRQAMAAGRARQKADMESIFERLHITRHHLRRHAGLGSGSGKRPRVDRGHKHFHGFETIEHSKPLVHKQHYISLFIRTAVVIRVCPTIQGNSIMLDTTSFETIVRNRRATRQFLSTPVPSEQITAVLRDAQHAPSNCNTQPWNVHIVSGTKRDELSQALLHAEEKGEAAPDFSFDMADFFGIYGERAQASGKALYDILDIAREDRIGRREALLKNFDFFGAPHVALMFMPTFGDNVRTAGDLGMYGQTFLLSLKARGLAGIPQTSLSFFAPSIRSVLGISDEYRMLFGISFGYGDPAAVVNRLDAGRADISESVIFHG